LLGVPFQRNNYSFPKKHKTTMCPTTLLFIAILSLAAALDVNAPPASPANDRPVLSGLFTSITLPTGQGGCSGTQEAILDIYPSSSGFTAPTVLHLPGGAYMNLVGDTVESAGQQYLDAGYTVAVLYYRLPRSATTTSWLVCSDPYEALDDVSSALTHLLENAADYNVVLSGFSAGGHLASLYSSLCNARSSACPAGQVLHFPFMEKGSKIFCSEVGTSFNALQDYDDCFPTVLVDEATPPTILYHSSGDPIVPTSEMTDFVYALGQQGTSYEYYEVLEGGGHYLVPFSQVAAVSNGVLDPSGDYASLIERALMLPNPSCVRCDDIATPWMEDNGKSCDVTTWLITNKCVEDDQWVTNGYCRSSCYDAGRGYANEVCCPPPTPPSSCTECSDDATPWMENNAKTCATSALETNCNENGWWVSNAYCQLSCFAAGRGYEGIDCCD